VTALSEAAGNRTADRVAGRDILAIQDTSEIVLGGPKMRKAGFGPVGRGSFLGGVLLHPVLAVDAMSGELLGLADIAVWNLANNMLYIMHSDPESKKNPRNGSMAQGGLARF
jgi:hypothetical protein